MTREAIDSRIDRGASRTPSADSRPRRIYIIGGPGSGKSWLANHLATLAEAPAFHLDEIAREGGGNTPERPLEERLRAVADIVSRPTWVTEGIYVGWTDDLMRSADVIVWLDYVSWPAALRRIVSRFVVNALGEMRRQRGWRKFGRFSDYRRHLRELLAAVPMTRSYYRRTAARSARSEVTRAGTEEYLRRYADKLVHCRTSSDVRALLRSYG